MSSRRERPRQLVGAGIVVAGTLAFAATAFGFVDVYSNDFSGKPEYREVKTVSGGHNCERTYKAKREVFEVNVTNGARGCSFKPPVQGTNSSPDHRFDATARIIKETPSSLRKNAYVSVSVRVGGGNRYELRVFPKTKKFQLRRKPDGSGFPAKGTNGDIKGIGGGNKLSLIVEGAKVRGLVNGTEVANVTDPNPEDVKGSRLEFAVGTTKDTKKDTVGNVDNLSVGVPNP